MIESLIHAIAHLHARADKTQELNSLLASLLDPTRQEPGCIEFALLRNRENPTEFVIVSRWRDEQAVRDHAASSYAQRALSELPGLLTGPLDLRFYDFLR
jgi:quinol monooxygenase YgiN